MKMWNLKEIQKLANKQSKKKGYLGYFQNFNAGNVPLGVSIFNSNMDTSNDPAESVSSIGTADGGVGIVGDAMGEKLEKTEGADEMNKKFKNYLKEYKELTIEDVISNVGRYLRANNNYRFRRVENSGNAIRAYESESLYYVPVEKFRHNLQDVDLSESDKNKLLQNITDAFLDAREVTLHDQYLSPQSSHHEYFTMHPDYMDKWDADKKYGFIGSKKSSNESLVESPNSNELISELTDEEFVNKIKRDIIDSLRKKKNRSDVKSFVVVKDTSPHRIKDYYVEVLFKDYASSWSKSIIMNDIAYIVKSNGGSNVARGRSGYKDGAGILFNRKKPKKVTLANKKSDESSNASSGNLDESLNENRKNVKVKTFSDIAFGKKLTEAVGNNFPSSELKKLKSLTRRGEDWYGIEWSDALDTILHKSVEAVLGPVDYIEPSTEGGEGTTFAWLENGDVYTWDFSSEADAVYQSIDSAKSWDDVYSAVEKFVRTHAEKDEDMSEGFHTRVKLNRPHLKGSLTEDKGKNLYESSDHAEHILLLQKALKKELGIDSEAAVDADDDDYVSFEVDDIKYRIYPDLFRPNSYYLQGGFYRHHTVYSIEEVIEEVEKELETVSDEDDEDYEALINALDKELDDEIESEIEYQMEQDSVADDDAILGYAMEAVFSSLPLETQRELVSNLHNINYYDMINLLEQEDFERYISRVRTIKRRLSESIVESQSEKNNVRRRKNVKSRIKEALDKTVFTDELLNKVKKEIESGKRSDVTFDIIEEVASEGIQDFFGDVDVEANVQFGKGDYRVYDDKGGYQYWDAEEDAEALDDAILNANTWDDAIADYVDFLDSAVMYHAPDYDDDEYDEATIVESRGNEFDVEYVVGGAIYTDRNIRAKDEEDALKKFNEKHKNDRYPVQKIREVSLALHPSDEMEVFIDESLNEKREPGLADESDLKKSKIRKHAIKESVKNVKVETVSDAEDDYIPDPEFTKLEFEGIYDYDPEVKITDYEMPFGEDYSEREYEDTWQYRYERVGSKRVRSGDGIETDYTIYYDNENNNYIAIFGDEKYFNPSNTKYWDVFNSKEEALNYLNNCDNNNSEQNKTVYIPVTVNKKIKSPYDVIDEDFIYDDQVDDYENHNYPSKKESILEYNDDAINSEETPYGYEEREEQIKKAERNIISLKAELRFLTFVAPMELKRGGAFDSKEEIDDAKEQVLKALKREERRLAALKRR